MYTDNKKFAEGLNKKNYKYNGIYSVYGPYCLVLDITVCHLRHQLENQQRTETTFRGLALPLEKFDQLQQHFSENQLYQLPSFSSSSYDLEIAKSFCHNNNNASQSENIILEIQADKDFIYLNSEELTYIPDEQEKLINNCFLFEIKEQGELSSQNGIVYQKFYLFQTNTNRNSY